jgi:hypothetical protein
VEGRHPAARKGSRIADDIQIFSAFSIVTRVPPGWKPLLYVSQDGWRCIFRSPSLPAINGLRRHLALSNVCPPIVNSGGNMEVPLSKMIGLIMDSLLASHRVLSITVCALIGAFSFPTYAAPGNDHFSSREQIGGMAATMEGNLAESTRETGEPLHAVYGTSGSIWWTWTAPSNGIVEIKNQPGLPAYALAQVVAVYAGDSINGLDHVASESAVWNKELYFIATAGQTYQIAVSHIHDDPVVVRLSLDVFEIPGNDDFVHREVVVPDATHQAFNVFATVEPGEPGDTAAGKTLWWTWTAPAHAVVNVHHPESTQVHLFSGSDLQTLQPRIWGTAYGIGGYEVQEGESFQIRVDGAVHVQFSMSYQIVPTNDFFARRTVLQGLPVEIAGDNTLSSAEPGEPMHMKQEPMNTLWFQWTAARSEKVGVILDAPWISGLVSVYTGQSISNLVCVAGARYSPAPLIFKARAGRTYLIAVGTTSTTSWGTGPFKLSLVGPASNDLFNAAIPLIGRRAESESYTTRGTMESGEKRVTKYDSRESIWWSWVAPYSGLVNLTLDSKYPVPLQIYIGDQVSHLTPINFVGYSPSWNGTTASFMAAEGTVYRIRASGLRAVQDGKMQISNGKVALELVLSALKVEPLTQDYVEDQGFTLTASMLQPEFSYPTSLTFSVSRDDWVPWTGTVASPPWQYTFTNVSPGIHSISVSGLNSAGEEEFSMPLIVRVRPSNDDFQNRKVVGSLPAVIQGAFKGSTLETGEPLIGNTQEKGSMWHAWTPTAQAEVRVRLYSGRLSIFEGDSLENIVLVKTLLPGEQTFNAVPNHRYHLRFSTDGDTEPTSYFAAFGNKQANDSFTNRITLSGSMGSFVADTSAATFEAKEPGQTPSLWWSWMSPADGFLILNHSNSSSIHFGIYQGTSVSQLRTLFLEPDGQTSDVIVPVNGGDVYQVAVHTRDPQSTLPCMAQYRFAPRSTNDHFASRIVIGDNRVQWTANYNATREPGEPIRLVSGSMVEATLWWEWTADSEGVAYLDIESLGLRPFVEVFEGTGVGSLTSLMANTTYFQAPDKVSFSVKPGHKYYISAGGISAQHGDFRFTLHTGPPPNDNFEEAIPASGTNFQFAGTLWNSTLEVGEPNVWGDRGTVWYRWTAPSSGWANIESNAGVASSVYVGTAVDSLSPVFQQSFGAYLPRFKAIAGQTYHIAISSYSQGQFFVPFYLEADPQ